MTFQHCCFILLFSILSKCFLWPEEEEEEEEEEKEEEECRKRICGFSPRTSYPSFQLRRTAPHIAAGLFFFPPRHHRQHVSPSPPSGGSHSGHEFSQGQTLPQASLSLSPPSPPKRPFFFSSSPPFRRILSLAKKKRKAKEEAEEDIFWTSFLLL